MALGKHPQHHGNELRLTLDAIDILLYRLIPIAI